MSKNLTRPAYSMLRDILREEIITGRIPAGCRLTIAEIAQKHSVSHMPVREALQWLQGEGLLEIIPNKGACVLQVDAEFVGSVYDTRSVIEVLLAQTAFRNFDDERRSAFHRSHEEFCTAADSGDITRIYDGDRAFHLSFYLQSRNRPALEIYNKYSALILTLRKKYGFSTCRVQAMVQQHGRILEAVDADDASMLEIIIHAHAQGGKEDLLNRMRIAATAV